MLPVKVKIKAGLAHVIIDNPPVNALNQSVRAGLADAVLQLENDNTVNAVVIMGAGKHFVSGADIRELGKPPLEPQLPDVLNAIENSTKPWVAAISGSALGGGLEIAMACHARIADTSAKLGLPEVTIGVIPGAGGTVRLPRLIPMPEVIKMITTGKPISATRAGELGLLDGLADQDLVGEAETLAAKLAQAGRPTASSAKPLLASTEIDWEAEKQQLISRVRGAVAPLEALAALKNAQTMSISDAMADARERFLRLAGGTQSAALRHIFFAERNAGSSLREVSEQAADLSRVGIIGGGTMGAGIAAALLISGSQLRLVERDAKAAESAHNLVVQTLQASAKRQVISQSEFESAQARLTTGADYAELADCELVIEAVFENMQVKHEVFAKLDAIMPEDAILATNTSYLDINEIADASKHPSRVVGLHFFSPAHIMKLLEVVRATATGPRALATAAALARRLRKIAVVAGVCDGFIGNRIMAAYRRECEFMLEEGATPLQIDSAMQNFGFAMGIYAVQDMSGLDIAWAQRKARAATRPASERYAHIADRLCEAGRFGRKTGKGWYNYESGKAQQDPEVIQIIEEERIKAGRKPVEFSEADIIDRILSVMQQEGWAVLDEKIAESADDIDVVMVTGYGFPRHRGGPMFMLTQISGC